MRVLPHFLVWALGIARAQTQTSTAERKCVAQHAAGRGRLVEIGVWHGVTTTILRRSMSMSGVLYAVDPYPPGRLGISLHQIIAHREVATVATGTVEWLRMTGVEAAKRMTAPVDLVFIDGDHSYEGLRADWESWSPLIASGGAVALHDSRSCPGRDIGDAGSVRFTQEVILRDPLFEVVAEVDSLTVLKRRALS